MLMLLEKLQVDKLRGWKPCHNTPITEAVEQQTQDVQLKFNGLLDDVAKYFFLLHLLYQTILLCPNFLLSLC